MRALEGERESYFHGMDSPLFTFANFFSLPAHFRFVAFMNSFSARAATQCHISVRFHADFLFPLFPSPFIVYIYIYISYLLLPFYILILVKNPRLEFCFASNFNFRAVSSFSARIYLRAKEKNEASRIGRQELNGIAANRGFRFCSSYQPL